MRVLVGVMYCIENEFNSCIQSIKEQSHIPIDYFVIKNLPNKDAHDLLYRTFMERARECDLFLKIDADMVFASSEVVKNIVKRFHDNVLIEHMQFAVHDYFTDRLVYGLNVFRSNVTWERSSEKYFVDIPTKKLKKLNFKERIDDLVPAAFHCPNPSDFQSFHFGLHKMAKIFQNGDRTWNPGLAISHANNIRAIYLNFSKINSDKHYFSLLGALWAFSNNINHTHVDFNSIETKRGFEHMIAANRAEMIILIQEWIDKYNLKCEVNYNTVCRLKYKSKLKCILYKSTHLINKVLFKIKRKILSFINTYI